ncbi:Abi-alpha family protein [Nocardia mangyaensis]|uniref:Abi-alpha family protein n=1 Tax=Nocardia mangyaensis TaxID=2213200 RepID=UPI0026745A61|nr:Abi-alpha family protein [Nocardia mangyaensis]MDO3650279.1 Abi-alpha family protein [Nocardia mangyaensis]
MDVDDGTPSTEVVRRSVPPLEIAGDKRGVLPMSPARTVRAATGVARVAFTAASGMTLWTLDTALGVTVTVLRGSLAGAPPNEVLAEAETEVRDRLRHALGLPPTADHHREPGMPTLREQGAELLRLSASTHAAQPDTHPAYPGILAEITPDEARILRFLHVDGPQPSIDVRTGRQRAFGGERLISGLTLLGEHAGLRFPNRVPKYLPNLRRLGLIEFTREPVGNPHRYQLIEAQEQVRDAMKRGFGTKVNYRSILLTEFGADFVQTCLPTVINEGRETVSPPRGFKPDSGTGARSVGS